MDDRLINDRYDLVEVIGQGAMGKVWRGHDRLLDRDVAIKEVLFGPDLTGVERAELAVQAMAEARATARLSHPGIITVFDVVEHDGVPMIVMELIHGRSLAAILKHDVRLPWRRTAEIGIAILDALREAHTAGIVHRDLKPANVLITNRRVILTDFGIAQHSGHPNNGQPGDMTGTPAFMAPEQAEGAPTSEAADLWSLGATLYNAVEGRPPYTGPDYVTILLTLLTQDPTPPRAAGPLTPIIKALLQRDPTRRATADHTATLLQQALADPASTPSSPTARRTSGRPAAATSGSAATSHATTGPAATGHASSGSAATGSAATGSAATTRAASGPAAAGPAGATRAASGTGGSGTGGRGASGRAGGTGLGAARTGAGTGGVGAGGSQGARGSGQAVPLPRRPVRHRPSGPLPRLLGFGLGIVMIFGFAIGMTAFTDRGSHGGGHAEPAPPAPPPIDGLGGPQTSLSAAAFSPDGKLAVLGVDGRTARLYDVTKHRRIRDLTLDSPQPAQPEMALAFSPGGDRLAVAGGTGVVEIFDVATGHREAGQGEYSPGISELRFSPDGQSLRGLTRTGRITTWSLTEGGAEWASTTNAAAPADDCGNAALTPDGRTVACLAGDDTDVTLFDVSTHKKLAKLTGPGQHPYVPQLAFSPDGRTLAVSANITVLWDASTGKRIDATPEDGFDYGARLAFDPQGADLIIGAATEIGIWPLAAPRLLRYATPSSEVTAFSMSPDPVAVSPDGRTVLDGGKDGLRLYDLASGKELAHWSL